MFPVGLILDFEFFVPTKYFGERFDSEVPLNVDDEYDAYNQLSRHEDLEFDFGKLQDIELEEVDLDDGELLQTE